MAANPLARLSARSCLRPPASALALALAACGFAAHAEGLNEMPPTGAGNPANSRVLEVFAKTDVDHDGRLSKDEAKALPAISEQFGKLDRDGDGFLTQEEFQLAFRSEAKTSY